MGGELEVVMGREGVSGEKGYVNEVLCGVLVRVLLGF